MWVVCGAFFMFFKFYRLDLHDITLVALAYLQLNVCKTHPENQTLLDSIMVITSVWVHSWQSGP